MKPILYYAADCPDTAPFVAELKTLGRWIMSQWKYYLPSRI